MSLSQEMNSVSVLANQFTRREKKYRDLIEQNNAIGNSLASRLSRGDLDLLGEEFTNECREKLKTIVKDNVTKERKLKAYMNAVKSLKNNYSPGQENKDNFQQKMEVAYVQELEKIERTSILVTQEETYLNLLEKLGEQDDEDDELAVVNPKSSDSNDVKCPLTMAIMEDPGRSKVCKHSFSDKAIRAHLKQSRRCPVPGCVNNNMTTAELEHDPDIEMLVRRFKKREEIQKRKREKSANDIDEDDYE